jgi:two-component system response regulator/two-component system chemotaxis response regulator CheY
MGFDNLVKKRILIVEDDIYLAEILTLMLSSYDCIVATDGKKAVKLYDIYKPALVLMDIQLSEMSGIDATRKILEKHPDAKIVGITAFKKRLGKDLLDAGALEVIEKPFTRRTLIGVVEKYLGEH